MNSLRFLAKKEIIGTILFAFILTLFFIQTQHVEIQGFNPTDDGVILAQSWRLINGETPHIDFISIRPVGSGVLHMIHFYSPLPLMISARWFVLFQFFIIAFVVSLLAKRFLAEEYKINTHIISWLSLLSVVFALSSMNYNMYPWTTIDAVFWTVLSAPLIIYGRKSFSVILGLILISFAALSRQNFAILTLASFLWILFKYRKTFLKGIIICLFGALPFILYLTFLLKHDAFDLFISQMSGRTELIETGFIQYGKRFLTGLTAPINFICLFIATLLFLRRKTEIKNIFIQKGFPSFISIIFSFIAVIHILRYFLLDHADLFGMPFELFFMLFSLTLLNFSLSEKVEKIHFFIFISLLIAWTSSISLGDNSPIFTMGILIVAFILLIIDFNIKYPIKPTEILLSKYTHLVVAVLILTFCLYSQRNVNYRDLGHKYLTGGLNLLSENFGGVKTNPATFAYYNDLVNIYNSFEEGKYEFIVLPHNPVFYPVMEIRNPAPLDWIQPYEYVGLEQDMLNSIEELVVNNNNLVFIVDRIDLRRIHKDIYWIKYSEEYKITNHVINNCSNIDINSDFFRVYISNNNTVQNKFK